MQRQTLAIALLAALILAAPSHAQDPGEAPHATWRITLQGAWAAPDASPSELSMQWQAPEWIRGADGRFVATYPVRWDVAAVPDGPSPDGTRYYHSNDGTWLAHTRQASEDQDDAQDMLGLYRTWESGLRQESRAQWLPPATTDCLMAYEARMRTVCHVPGFLAVTGPVDTWRVWTTHGAQGIETVLEGRTGTTQVVASYAEGTPFAVRVEVRTTTEEGPAWAVLELQDWHPWKPVDPVDDLPHLEPAQRTGTDTHRPSEVGLAHAFPLEEAVQEALDEPAGLVADDREKDNRPITFHEWIEVGQPILYHAEHLLVAGEPPDHVWLLGWSNGVDSMWLEATKDGDPVSLVTELSSTFAQDNITFRMVDPPFDEAFLPDISWANHEMPMVTETMRWWREYAGDEWDGMGPDSYGFHLGCQDCPRPTARVWAGVHEQVRRINETATQTHVEHVRVRSYLHLDLDGHVLAYEEGREIRIEGEAYGPSSESVAASTEVVVGRIDAAPKGYPVLLRADEDGTHGTPGVGVATVLVLGAMGLAAGRRVSRK